MLRRTDTVRLVFKPTLVNNENNSEAVVNGVLCYQRKRRSDTWEDCSAISLSTLRAGEGVRLELRSTEVLELFRGLRVLYDTVTRDGIPTGTHTYIQADRGSFVGDLVALLDGGAMADTLETFMRWAQDSGEALTTGLQGVDDRTLLNFDTVLGAARLQKFLDGATASLDNDNESYWQSLFAQQSWIISQIFAAPLVILRQQMYVGGKSIDNRGGSIVDYLFRNALTGNSLLVELKTPVTPLLTARPYRNGVYGPSSELGGATQQLLHARQNLQEDYLVLTRSSDERFNIFSTRALLIIGTMPDARDDARVRSFEVYRNAHRNVEIVTFDELLRKGQNLLDALNS